MAANKTQANRQPVGEFLKSVPDATMRRDCQVLSKLMRAATGKRATMWGDSMVGFGRYHYRYESGREGDFFLTGYAPRKQNLAIYIMPGFSEYGGLLARLGKHKTGKSCLYIKRLDDVDLDILAKLVNQSVADMRQRYECN